MSKIKTLQVFVIYLALSTPAVFGGSAPDSTLCEITFIRQIIEQQWLESKGIEEYGKRIDILVKIADLMWTIDAKTSHEYFAEAYQAAQNRFQEQERQKNEGRNLAAMGPDYRFEVIRGIAKRDPEWAKRLSEIILAGIEKDDVSASENRGGLPANIEVQKILNIAAGNAKDNPELALGLARRVMRYSLTANWYFGLFAIAKENQRLADTIYGEVLALHDSGDVNRFLYLSAYPFSRNQIFGIEKYSLGTSVPPVFSPDPQFKRRFLTAFLRRALQLSPESTSRSGLTGTPDNVVAFTALIEFEPIVAAQFPDLAQILSQAKIHVSSIVGNDALEAAKKRGESDINSHKPFERQLKDVEKADSEGRLTDIFIFNLITSAKTEEDFALAETWLDKIKEGSAREGAVNYFYFMRSKLAITENRIDQARKYAGKVVTIQHQAILLLDIAAALYDEPSRRNETWDTLLEIDKMANKTSDSVEKAQVYFALAGMYGRFEQTRYQAFVSLSDAIRTTNNLEKVNLFSSTQTQKIIGKDYSFYASYSIPGFDINRVFHDLSVKNLEDTLSQAGRFTDRYYRSLALLAAVKDCAANSKKRSPRKTAS
jgi:hypothetical protein